MRAVQYLLRSGGAAVVVDGVFDGITRAGVEAFQADQGLPVDGVVGPGTWLRLAPAVAVEARGDAVRGAQLLLQASDHPVDIDGIFGAGTQSAVRDRQTAAALTVTGAMDADTWAALLQPPVPPSTIPAPTLRDGTTGPTVTALQYLLREKGFRAESPDGSYDVATGEQVGRLQAAVGTPVSGTVDPATWPHLLGSVGPGATGDVVRAAQALLAGTLAIAVDGVFGLRTANALRAFAIGHGLAPTPLVDRRAWQTLLDVATVPPVELTLPLSEYQQKTLRLGVWRRYEGTWSATWTATQAANYDIRARFAGSVVLRQPSYLGSWDASADLTVDARGSHWYCEAAGRTEISVPDLGYFRPWWDKLQLNLFSSFRLAPSPVTPIPREVSLRYRVTEVVKQPPSPDVGEPVLYDVPGPSGPHEMSLTAEWPDTWPLRLAGPGRAVIPEHNATHELVLARRSDAQLLWYDGVFLNLVVPDSASVTRRWRAFSGSPGLDASPASQRLQDRGPTPAGLYRLDPKRTLTRDRADGAWDWIKWTAKGPTWGLVHTELEAFAETRTFGRSEFNVHGGARPGSKGCIDLVEGNAEFHDWLRGDTDHRGEPYVRYLLVVYVPLAQQFPRTHADPMNCRDNPGLYCTQNSACSFNGRFAGGGLPQYQEEHRVLLDRLVRELWPR